MTNVWSFLLLSHVHLSTRKITGCLNSEASSMFSAPTTLLLCGGQVPGIGGVPITCVAQHCDVAVPVASTHSKTLNPNFSVSLFLLLFTLIKTPQTATYKRDTDKMKNTKNTLE